MELKVAVEAAHLERPQHLYTARDDQESAAPVAAVRSDQDPQPGRVEERALAQVNHDPAVGASVQFELSLERCRQL